MDIQEKRNEIAKVLSMWVPVCATLNIEFNRREMWITIFWKLDYPYKIPERIPVDWSNRDDKIVYVTIPQFIIVWGITEQEFQDATPEFIAGYLFAHFLVEPNRLAAYLEYRSRCKEYQN